MQSSVTIERPLYGRGLGSISIALFWGTSGGIAYTLVGYPLFGLSCRAHTQVRDISSQPTSCQTSLSGHTNEEPGNEGKMGRVLSTGHPKAFSAPFGRCQISKQDVR